MSQVKHGHASITTGSLLDRFRDRMSTQKPQLITKASLNASLNQSISHEAARNMSTSIKESWYILEPEINEKFRDIVQDDRIVDIRSVQSIEIKRQETIYELTVTEADFVDSLVKLQYLFIHPIIRHELLPPSDIAALFSNVEQLVPINQELLDVLHEKRARGRCMVQHLGDIFLRMCPFFRLYNEYCSNFTDALNKLSQLLALDARFADFVKDSCADAGCADLASILIKPVQRLCKYPLLLEQVLKYTPPSHPDHEPLFKALKLMEKVVNRVNEGRRFREDQKLLLQVMSHLLFAGTGLASKKKQAAGPTTSHISQIVSKSMNGKSLKDSDSHGNLSIRDGAGGASVDQLPPNFNRRVIKQSGVYQIKSQEGNPGRPTSRLMAMNTNPNTGEKMQKRLAVLFNDALVVAKPVGIQHHFSNLNSDIDDLTLILSESNKRVNMGGKHDDSGGVSDSRRMFKVRTIVLLTDIVRITDLATGILVNLKQVLDIPKEGLKVMDSTTRISVESVLPGTNEMKVLTIAFGSASGCFEWYKQVVVALREVRNSSPDLNISISGNNVNTLALQTKPQRLSPVSTNSGANINVIGMYAPQTPTTNSVNLNSMRGTLPNQQTPLRVKIPPPPPPRRRVSHTPVQQIPPVSILNSQNSGGYSSHNSNRDSGLSTSSPVPRLSSMQFHPPNPFADTPKLPVPRFEPPNPFASIYDYLADHRPRNLVVRVFPKLQKNVRGYQYLGVAKKYPNYFWLPTFTSSMWIRRDILRSYQNGHGGRVTWKPVLGYYATGLVRIYNAPSCILWLKYGLLLPDMAISMVNGTGMILSLIYTTIYFRNHPNNDSLEMPLILGALIVFPALIYSRLVSLETATRHIGNLACICSIVMFGSPLVSLGQVIKVKSASSMSLLSVSMSFLTASLWTYYGLLINDMNVILPNAMGAVLACVNLFVIAYYGRVDINYRRVH